MKIRVLIAAVLLAFATCLPATAQSGDLQPGECAERAGEGEVFNICIIATEDVVCHPMSQFESRWENLADHLKATVIQLRDGPHPRGLTAFFGLDEHGLTPNGAYREGVAWESNPAAGEVCSAATGTYLRPWEPEAPGEDT